MAAGPQPQHARRAETEDTAGCRVVGLLADPDRPGEISRSLVDRGRLRRELSRRLGDRFDDAVVWEVRARVNVITVGVTELGDAFDAAARHRDEHGWHWVVYLTDLPVRAGRGRGPVLAEVDLDRGVAAVSLPAVGGFALERRIVAVVVGLVGNLCGPVERRSGRLAGGASRALSASLARGDDAPDGDAGPRVVLPRWRGRARLLAGMIRTNHPGRIVVGMATAFAATVAASAFMIFNTSTWQIATGASPLRLVLALVAGMALLLAWIITRHGLWERRRDEPDRGLRWLYNLATLGALGLGVLALTSATFVVDLCAVLFLLSPSALARTLGRAPDFTDWLGIAALATVAATMAGALGVSLQREQDLRNAAYGYRQREHRRLARARQDQEPDGSARGPSRCSPERGTGSES